MRFTQASLEVKKTVSWEVVFEKVRVKYEKSATLEASEAEARS